MSRRSILRDYQVFNNADSTTDPSSTQTDISGVDKIAYRLTIGASVNAVASVRVSNKEDKSNPFTLNFGQSAVLVGASETEYLFTIENRGFKWMWIEVANNGGTGNIDGWVTGTTVGA
jgi:hypothetical protein